MWLRRKQPTRQRVTKNKTTWNMEKGKARADRALIALSRAYYACFHALTAALYAINVVRGKHSGVQAALSEFLVKPRLIEEEDREIYQELFKYRQTNDHEPYSWPEPEETRRLLADTERFVARMEAFLREQGFES